VRALVDRAFSTAAGILERHRDVLENSARLLLEKETLDEAQLKAHFARMQTAAPAPKPDAKPHPQ
jgi:cell division protease FtsH